MVSLQGRVRLPNDSPARAYMRARARALRLRVTRARKCTRTLHLARAHKPGRPQQTHTHARPREHTQDPIQLRSIIDD
jgi:hypothetical protein